MKWVDEEIEGEIDAKQFGGISNISACRNGSLMI